MAKTRAIVKRRKAIRNIRKITRTMELIATARFRQALDRATRAEAFTRKIAEMAADLSASATDIKHPLLEKRHPDYEAINRIFRVREDMVSSGLRPRLFAPVTVAILGRLKDGERKSVLSRMSLPASELRAVQDVETEALKIAKHLSGPKTAAARDAYNFLEKAPLDLLAYILAESSNGKAVGKIKTYFSKWKPIRQALPGVATELELLGMERGPKFDKVVEDFFQLQLLGRARKPEDHAKILRKLAGIKELPKKVEEKKKPEKPKKKGEPAPKQESAVIAAPAAPGKIQPHRMAPGKAAPVPAQKPTPRARKK